MIEGEARAESWELSRACARFAAGLDDGTNVVALVDRIVDLEEAIATTRNQGLLAWLARALASRASTELATAVRDARVTDAARTLAQVRLLGTITNAFSRANIPMLPYKGPALSLQLYGDVALRDSTDLDIVVAKADYQRARAELHGLGLPSRGGHSAMRERTLFGWLGHASFGRGRDDFVELHWRFAPAQFAFALDPMRALERCVVSMVAGVTLPLMATDDLLATLSMHGTRHMYERLEWLSGVTRLLLETADSPTSLVRQASALRAKRMLLASVHVAHRVLGFPISREWIAELRNEHEAVSAGEGIALHLEACGSRGMAPLDGLSLQLLYGRLTDSRRDQLGSIVRAALMPTEQDADCVTLPDGLTPLYWVVRPFRLIHKYTWRMVGRA